MEEEKHHESTVTASAFMVECGTDLACEFSDTSATWGVDNQFLWGPWLMVVPVLDQGVVARDVYFPPATWYDYHTVSTQRMH
ncbi:putative maltase-glucoamylase 2 [Portunus trituberculatus]|uniref:Putative maltase-glucoamylase 2 n=1 Tax=Portunus trituberculatus TaxID=210409 RepID=A0A5B7JU76_PORTR|nr:putative maltase-glucoamylase 2 [Portunus trituberculatus]